EPSPASQSPHSANACTIRSVWVTSNSRRRGNRSASAPPTAPSSRSGTTVMNAISVTFAALRVATATTQSSAASCMLPPMLEPIAPAQNTRKSWKDRAQRPGERPSEVGLERGRLGVEGGVGHGTPGLPGSDAGDLHGLGVLPGAEEGPGARPGQLAP